MFKEKTDTTILGRSLVAGFLGLCLLLAGLTAHAEGVLIKAPKRADMVYDDARNVLYITNGKQLLRYNLTTATFLAPLELGGKLMGIDISPDGNFLAVANGNYTESSTWIHLVNINTWTATRVRLSAGAEAGSYSVAYDNTGRILISCLYPGSGWVALHKYDPATGTKTTLGEVSEYSMLRASGDRSVIVIAEGNNSSGPFGRYMVGTGDLNTNGSTNWYNYEVGVNFTGKLMAIPTYGGTFLASTDDLRLRRKVIGEYAGGQPIAAAFHPSKYVVYFPWAQSRMVKVYDTKTWLEVGEYDFENTFDHPGNSAYVEGRAKTSKDGSLLFVTVAGGVRYVQTREAAE